MRRRIHACHMRRRIHESDERKQDIVCFLKQITIFKEIIIYRITPGGTEQSRKETRHRTWHQEKKFSQVSALKYLLRKSKKKKETRHGTWHKFSQVSP
jgi:hypothetical protein